MFGMKWWVPILAINLWLVFVTTIFPHVPNFVGKWILMRPFLLHLEATGAAWWSSILLLWCGLLCVNRFHAETQAVRYSWLLMGAIMAGLSLDEMGSLHERVGLAGMSLMGDSTSNAWLAAAPFIAILVALVGYAVLAMLRHNDSKNGARLLFMGFGCYALVAAQEYLEQFTLLAAGPRAGLEEGTELMGSMLIMAGALSDQNSAAKKRLSDLLPTSKTLQVIPLLVMIGLTLHLVGTFVLLAFDSPYHRGNPLVWFPASCMSIASISYVARQVHLRQALGIAGLLLVLLSLLASIELSTSSSLLALRNFIDSELITQMHLSFYLLLAGFSACLFIRPDPSRFGWALILLLSIVSFHFISDIPQTHWRYTWLGSLTAAILLWLLRTLHRQNVE